ncbi:MAG TPA: hypothetical protein VGJ06_21330 [Candidatus Acidoferrum sp.]
MNLPANIETETLAAIGSIYVIIQVSTQTVNKLAGLVTAVRRLRSAWTRSLGKNPNRNRRKPR